MGKKRLAGAGAGLGAVAIGAATTLSHNAPELTTALRSLQSEDKAAIITIEAALRRFDQNRVTTELVLGQIETRPTVRRLDEIVEAASERIGQSVKGSLCETYHRLRQGGSPPTFDDIAQSLGGALLGVPDAASLAYSVVGELSGGVTLSPQANGLSKDSRVNISSALLCFRGD